MKKGGHLAAADQEPLKARNHFAFLGFVASNFLKSLAWLKGQNLRAAKGAYSPRTNQLLGILAASDSQIRRRQDR